MMQLSNFGFFCKWRFAGSAGSFACCPPTNQLTVDGATLPFSALIPVGCSVDDNQIGDAGAKDFAEAIKVNGKMTRIG
jgi:hypothetical protein